ncbi:hypothetical protein JTB14_009797 [Gonioctena quinquepunctata]|nr:hypothetical protein JTB14_009797 [Gonioctena quinquepunctata]
MLICSDILFLETKYFRVHCDDMKSESQQYYDNLKINSLFCLAIFGNKKYLRFDEDHEKLLTCLELSDIEGCDNEDDDSENENGNAYGIHEENVEEQSEISAENFNEEDIEEDLEIQSDFESHGCDPEMNIPLSTLKDQ